jgi:hypothetical protein
MQSPTAMRSADPDTISTERRIRPRGSDEADLGALAERTFDVHLATKSSPDSAQRFLPESTAKSLCVVTRTAGLNRFEIAQEQDRCKIPSTHHARMEPRETVHFARLSLDDSNDQLALLPQATTPYRQLDMADDNTTPSLFETARAPPSNCKVLLP